MRVAYLVSRYPAVSHAFVQREVRGLRETGMDVLTVSVRRAGPEDVLSDVDREEAGRTLCLVPPGPGTLVRAHLAAARNPLAWLGTLVSAVRDAPGARAKQVLYWGEAVLLWDLLRRRGHHHVHAHFANNGSDIAMLTARLGRRAGRGPSTFSLTVHGPTDFYDVVRKRLALKGEEAAGVLCISDFARSQMMGQVDPEHWARLHVARYGAPPIDGLPAGSDRGPGDALRVLTVGRLAPVKAQALLLEALAAVVGQGIDARLDVVGDGPLRGQLEETTRRLGLGDRVTFHGARAQDEVMRLYAASDVFCLASVAEGLPVVALEAMAFGLPVVAPAIMGIPEAVRHEREGLLVTPGRADELADALLRLGQDAELVRRLGEAGRERAAGEFSHERSIAGIRAALEAVAGTARRAVV
jgi:colanic acid/amylovoran biosynthesis glycosyltransferase